MKEIQDIDTALRLFEKASVAHSEATTRCDYKKCNKAYDIVIKTVTFLRKHDEILRLLPFLNHHSVGARTWAATYLLSAQPQEAIKTLEEVIMSHDGLLSSGAEIVLREHRNGTLLPFYNEDHL